MHLFDIDVPGKIRFQESEVLSPGNELMTFDTGVYSVCHFSQYLAFKVISTPPPPPFLLFGVFSIIHGSRRVMKNGEGLGILIT